MTRVEIIFPDVQKARMFLTWLCECGEQYYFQDMEDIDPEHSVSSFNYHWNHLVAITERNTEQ
jgi:hypothetical protein